MRAIGNFQLVDHGIEHEQYFQGCGVAWTEFIDVATGIGSNPAEAIDDCLEQLASAGWEAEGMEKRIIRECLRPGKRSLPKTPRVSAKHGDCYYYVSIRVASPELQPDCQ